MKKKFLFIFAILGTCIITSACSNFENSNNVVNHKSTLLTEVVV